MHTLINKGTSLVKFPCVESSSLRSPCVPTSCLDVPSQKFSLGFLVHGEHLSVFCLLGLGSWFGLEHRVCSCLL